MNYKTINTFGFVGYEELSKSRRVLSTSAGNTLLDLHKSYLTSFINYNETLYNEVLGKTNNFLIPSNSKIYGKEPQYGETSL